MVKKILDQWKNEETKKYGSIVYMETGSGKTFISIMVIKALLKETTYPTDTDKD